jgi:uncharacterized phiE125 gp8 family phage protein
MPLSLVSAPSVLPLTVAETKDHLRVDTSDDDDLITAMISAATDHVSGRNGWTGRALVEQTWDLKLDAFPCAGKAIKLPLAPLQSVTSVKYIDTDGVEQTLSDTVYAVDADSVPGRVYLAYGQSWPGIRSQRNAVTIRFVCGYADDGGSPVDYRANIPEAIRAALKLLVGAMYENREDFVTGTIATQLPFAAQNLLMPYRVYGADW